jgi:F-type H+-transporting ATPase subunit gamma
MSQSYERIVARLNNLRAIEPLLGALRTISMGTWQIALNKLGRLADYQENYQQILAQIAPLLKKERPGKSLSKGKESECAQVLLLIGTERGLCGKFNENLVADAQAWMESQPETCFSIWAMGSRMTQALSQQGLAPDWSEPLSANSLSSYHQAYLTTQGWLQSYEAATFDRLTLFHQKAKGEGKVEAERVDLLPFTLEADSSAANDADLPWPPPIVETDPEGIFRQLNEHFIASTFYRALLESAVAEHSSRFILMEEAKKNADDIITALNRDLNVERKRKITREMQELAIGAGLIDNR